MKKAKTNLYVMLAAGLGLTLGTSCNNATPPAETETPAETVEEVVKPKEPSTKVTTTVDIHEDITLEHAEAMMDSYIKIKNALVQSHGEEAQVAAREFLNLLDHETDPMVADLRNDVLSIADSVDTHIQRNHFHTLSHNMYVFAKSTGAGKDRLYVHHCPMAMNHDGGHWISDTEEVLNPYFGEHMLNCGKIEEKL
jgi:hypothetical protein